MSDLLRLAELARERVIAENRANQFEAEKKKIDALRAKGTAALRAFLPADFIWEIKTGELVWITDTWGGSTQGIKMEVDGILFAWGESRGYSGRPSTEKENGILVLGSVCSRCGHEYYSWFVNSLADIAANAEAVLVCRSCQQEEWDLAAKSDAAISLEDPDGRWLTISWDGQINHGKMEKVEIR